MKIVIGDLYFNEIKKLIIQYTQELNRDLAFQNLESELNDLKHKYSYPNGRIYVAIENNKIIGCVGYHKHSQTRCEMKRLYVLPEYRKSHIGLQLVQHIMTLAKKDGYQEMVLDTIQPLQSAISLYKKMGFTKCEPYYYNPMEDVIYMKKELS